MPPWSATRPIRPSRASISRTKWPLPRPPMAGLQDMAPMVANLMRHQRRLRAHAGRRGRGFTAGMAAANHDNVEFAFALEPRSRGLVAEARGGVKKSLVFGEMFHVKHRPSEYRRTQVTPDSLRQNAPIRPELTAFPGTELDRVLARASILAAMSSRASLFADAEVAENHVQDILDVDPAGQAARGHGRRCRSSSASRSSWPATRRLGPAQSGQDLLSAWRWRRGSPAPIRHRARKSFGLAAQMRQQERQNPRQSRLKY